MCVIAVGSDKVLGTVTGRPDEQEVGYLSCLFFSSCSAVLEFLNVILAQRKGFVYIDSGGVVLDE